jgi:hypothetical protein
MVILVRFISFFLLLGLISCQGDSSLEAMDSSRINAILSAVNETSDTYTQKDVEFDSIVTYAGVRSYSNQDQKVKMKLFYFGEFARGYFNIKDLDDKNLQVFGRKVDGYWALKCVTKINMEEAGGYILLENSKKGIWSSGHINFIKEPILFTKQNTDYNSLLDW